ncbi:MAG: threonine-phosphate decarboxylase [Proteobacteria bacterium]|nr:threonine-phosphate decarboxylase [Pseudomonadota bacterium]
MTPNRWTWHGGGLSAARAHFGQEDWLDLSTGINPHAWPHAAVTPVDWRGLPDEQALRELEQAAAAHFGCDPDHVCAVPGTEVGLRLTGALLNDTGRHLSPTYRTHTEMLAGVSPIAFDALAQADGESLILANPNNPDGRLLDRATLLDILARRGRSGWLILDEAFADAHPGHTLADMVDDDRRLVVFRSFGKFFGLAGLRLGFVLGPRALLARLRAKLGAWPVSAAAIAIGTAAYRDSGWIVAMRDRLTAEAAELDAHLGARGYAVTGACPLFRLIECGDGSVLFERLARRGILTRPFEQRPGWLRLGLPGSREALARFITALDDHG